MAKVYLFVILTFLTICKISKSSDIDCTFSVTNSFTVVGSPYLCIIKSNPNIISLESATVNKITGTHQDSKTNDDVVGFYAPGGQVINYFPQGLDKFFKNVKTIVIYTSKLKEIHQSDLQPFTKLIYLNLYNNELEILEEGLLDFNPDLQVVGFHSNKLTHIDPNIFDNLSKLKHLWLDKVSCVNKNAVTSPEVQDSIKKIKTQCTSSEFILLSKKIKDLENQSKTLNSEEFSTSLNNFEKSFNNSAFSKFRPLNYKFENLKQLTSVQASTTAAPLINASTTQATKVETCKNCCQINDNSDLNHEIGNLTKEVKDQSAKVDESVKDIKTSQTQIQSSINIINIELSSVKDLQSEIKPTLTGVEAMLKDNEVKVNTVKTSQADLVNKVEKGQGLMQESFNGLKTKIENVKTTQNELIMSQEHLNNTLNDVTSKLNLIDASQLEAKSAITKIESSQDQIFNSLQDVTSKLNERDISHDKMKASISDIEVTLSDVKISQNEVLSSFLKLKTMQNELKLAINDLRSRKADNSEEKDSNASFETKAMETIRMEMSNTRHKMSINMDEKIKGIEKRLMKKFEDTLEEKLGKILEEKLTQILGNKLGN